MTATTGEMDPKTRAALRARGLKPVEIWAPDTGAPGFDDEIRRQCRKVVAAEAEGAEFAEFWDEIADEALRDAPPYE